MTDKHGNLPPVVPYTATEEAAIVAHAKTIYTKMVFSAHLTAANEIGHVTTANTAIDLAVLFHKQLKRRGYRNE